MTIHIATEQRTVEEELERWPALRQSVETRLHRIRSVADVSAGSRVLEIGSASGLGLAAFNELGFRAYGVEPWDQARKNSEEIAAHLRQDYEVRDGRAESIPYDDAYFDFVYANSVMEHVEDLEKSISEISRVLKPGGVFWFLTASSMSPFQQEIRGFPAFGWYPNSMKLKIMEWAKNNRPALIGHSDKPAIHWFTSRKARRILNQYGFDEIYDRWDVRSPDEGGKIYRWTLAVIQSSNMAKIIADILIADCSYTAIKSQ